MQGPFAIREHTGIEANTDGPLSCFMDKNYNYTRKKLRLPEYGRHIHEMIDFLMTIEDREQRNRQAKIVIGIMGNLNPMLRDTADFTHKLWDHLFIMADFQLDVDSPYPIPSRQMLNPAPRKMEYPRKEIAMKHYGKNVEKIIKALAASDDSAGVEAAVASIAKYMRTKSYEYNQEHPNNEIIIKDIKRMSDGSIPLDEVAINNIKSDYKQSFSAYGKKRQQKVHGGKNQHGNRQGISRRQFSK